MSSRKQCTECPWIKTNPHSLKFRGYVNRMKDLGKIKNHKCHMVSSDIWNNKGELNSLNVCIGSQNDCK